MTTQVIALDVGGTSVKSAAIGPGGSVVGPLRDTPINSRGSAEVILETLTGAIARHIVDLSLRAVALGFPGPFDYANGISQIQGVEKYDAIYGLDLRQALRARLILPEVPVLFRNDAEAAIIGEARYGAGCHVDRLIGVTLGTGLGSAFMVVGRAVSVGAGVPAQGWLYPFPFRGHRADDYFSRRGLLARLSAAGCAWAEVLPAAVAARGTDRGARHVFEAFGAELGEFLRPFVVQFEAQAVLVMGGIAGAMDLFRQPLEAALAVPVLAGERGAAAALLGAAELFYNP